MLVCYLDDSGKDPQNSITTIAGYAAAIPQWVAFEAKAETVFLEYGVKTLHAADLHGSRGEFVGWSILKKQAFVAKLCMALSLHALLGVSASAHKAQYKLRAAESGRKRTVTPYTFCSNLLIDWLLTDVRVGKLANTEGLALILESGHENNAEAELNFFEVRKQHNLDNILRSISFVGKEDCRAIQMADLFAFYSRRHGVEMEAASPEDRSRVQRTPGPMLNIMTESLPHRAFVATDFGPSIKGSRFFSGADE